MSTIVKSSCHCGRNTFNIAFLTESLPVSSNLCHCNSCRHSTGQLAINLIPFHGVPLSQTSNEPADLKNLTPYKTSQSATRWFCNTCSAHILWEYTDSPAQWYVAVGSLERVDGIIKSTCHIWVGDTLDGGIADHLRVVDGLELPRYISDETPDQTIPLGWRSPEIKDTEAHGEQLRVYCHCNSVKFYITRPSAASTLPTSPYTNFIFPSHSTPPSKIANPEDEKWWLRPAGAEKPTHYIAAHCACTSCRLASGFEIQSWAFIPRFNIFFESPSSQSPVELNLQDETLRPPALKHYGSSPGRHREFCGRCGATVFWWGEMRPDVVDVSVGLIDQSQGGARSEGWLDWWKDRVGFADDAMSKALIEGLGQGLQKSK